MRVNGWCAMLTADAAATAAATTDSALAHTIITTTATSVAAAIATTTISIVEGHRHCCYNHHCRRCPTHARNNAERERWRAKCLSIK
jgi:hypothetical protein